MLYDVNLDYSFETLNIVIKVALCGRQFLIHHNVESEKKYVQLDFA